MVSHELLLQGFNWQSWKGRNHYNLMKNTIHEMKKMKVTKLWLPPSSKSKHPEGYYPIDYSDLNSEYGTEKELVSLLDECKTNNISTIGDLVCWNEIHGYNREPYAFGDITFDVTSQDMYQNFKEYALYLQLAGFTDIRLDYLKSYPCYDIGLYLTNDEDLKDIGFVGEYWDNMNYESSYLSHYQDNHRQSIVNYIDKTHGRISMFDFTLKGILQEALNKNEFWRLCDYANNPPGVNGWYSSNTITFIDNHDTLGQHLWSFSQDKDVVIAGYAYIMTHPGTPCIYYDHFHDLKHELNMLSEIRQGIRDFKVDIIECSTESYRAQIDDNLMIIIGPHNGGSEGKNVLFQTNRVLIHEL